MIEKTSKIINVVAEALKAFKKNFSPGLSVDRLFKSFKDVLDKELKEYETIYDYIWGKDCKNAEGITRDYIPEQGDACIFDVSVKYNGVWCDITRTFFVREYSESQKEKYDLVKKSLKEAEKSLKRGAKAYQVYNAANKIYEQVGEKLVHHAGHKIAEEVISAPRFTFDGEGIIEEGNVYALETGLYGDFGIRLENDYMIVGDKVLNLTEKYLNSEIEEYVLK